MKINKLIRLFFLPFGLFLKLYELTVEGSRDIHNKLRFKDSVVDRMCCINSTSIIEQHCHILENTLILNSTINSYSYVGRNSIVQNACIGSFCSIANDVFIGLGTHPTNHFSTSPLFYRVKNTLNIQLIDEDGTFPEYQKIEIGNDVWIGARAIVMDGIRIGDGAIVAAGAVVTKDVLPYSIVGGVPAKLIRYRFEQAKIEQLLNLQWWTWSLSKIKIQMEELKNVCQ